MGFCGSVGDSGKREYELLEEPSHFTTPAGQKDANYNLSSVSMFCLSKELKALHDCGLHRVSSSKSSLYTMSPLSYRSMGNNDSFYANYGDTVSS